MDIDILYIFAALNKINIIQQIKIKMIRDFRNCSNNIIRFEQNQEAGNLPEVKDDNGTTQKNNVGYLNKYDAIVGIGICIVFLAAIFNDKSVEFSNGNLKAKTN